MIATKHLFDVHNRQMLQSECHLCSPVRAYWIHVSVSPEVSRLFLRTRGRKVYIRLSRSYVLWRTTFTTVHFLPIYPSAIKTDEKVTSETLVPAHQNIIHHIS